MNFLRAASGLYTRFPLAQFDVLRRELSRMPGESVSILDIGAGPANLWNKSNFGELVNKKNLKVTTLDANTTIDPTKNENSLVKEVKFGLAPEGLLSFKDDEFDFVIAFDLIEHLPKDQGYKLLYQINRICKHTSVIFTPNGHLWQPPSRNNEFNQHLSGWSPKELKSMGWKKLRGHTGLKILFGPYGLPKKTWIPNSIQREVSAVGAFLIYRLPGCAFSFTAVQRNKREGIEYHA